MMPLFLIILFPIVMALFIYLSYDKMPKIILFIMQLIVLGMAIYFFIYTRNNGIIHDILGDYQLGVGIALKSDNISSVLVLLNAFLFTCMILFNYHKSYMNKLFLFLFIILQGLMNGIFLANDMFTLYVLIELSTIVVSILIMFKKDSQSIYDGMIYLLTNIVSMTLFLLGMAYMYKMFGSLDLDIIGERIALIENPRSLILPYSLIITSIGLKSALMPLFSWLPRAHGTPSAPSIVSAILSGLYVKGGIYLFIRFQSIFLQQLDTTHIFLFLGFLTAVIGFMFALSQTDIKLILAYSTVSQIGLIIFGLSLNHDYSYWGSIYHIVNHAIFKSVLFLTAGIIIETYETRDIRQITGLFKRMPFVSIITIMAILGIIGAPLFNGSISKYLIQSDTTSRNYLEYGLILINLGTIMTFIKYGSMFRGPSKEKPISIRFNQKIAIALLGSFCLIGGVFGVQFIKILFDVTISVSLSSYINKTILFIISLVISWGFYTYLYSKIGLFKKIREIELTFNQICFSIVLFFSGMFGYLLYII